MATFVYNKAAQEIANGTIDLLNDPLKVMLVTSSYTADRNDDVVDAGGANDAVDHELTGTGYAEGWGGAGRKTLANKSIVEDDTNDRATFDADDVSWTAIDAGTAAAALIIKEGGADDTTSRLIAYMDIDNTVTNGGNFDIEWHADGIFQFRTA